MDIVELKGVNSKMLVEDASSSEQCILPETQHMHRASNLAYCDFDIMAHYRLERRNARQKMRAAKKDQTDKSKEKSELSKKIEDLTARNKKIRELLDAKDTISTDYNDKTSLTEKIEREHKNRRVSSRRKEGRSEEKSSDHKHRNKTSTRDDSFNSQEASCSTKMHTSDASPSKERRSKHRSRRERTEESKNDPENANRTGKISVTVSTSKDAKKQARRQSMPEGSSIVEKVHQHGSPEQPGIQESKSQLVSVYNYKTKSELQPDKEMVKNVITVYENNNVMEETDSIMSRDTLKKSRTKSHGSNRDANSQLHNNESDKSDFVQKSAKDCDFQYKSSDRPVRHSTRRSSRHHSRSSRKLSLSDRTHQEMEKIRRREMSPIHSVTPRKELSFSNLNLLPNVNQYESTGKGATTQTSVSRIRTPGFGTRSILVNELELEPERQKKKPKPLLSQTTIALRDIMQVKELEKAQQAMLIKPKPHSFMKNKLFPEKSLQLHQDFLPKSLSQKGALTMNTKFHKTKNVVNSDRIVEISSKILKDEKVNFTVEGVEPPRRLHSANESVKSMKVENVFTLQLFPGIMITQNDLSTHSHAPMNNLPAITNGEDNKLNEQSSINVDLGTCQSDNKPRIKESSEISYKFRKKSWSSKELPKKRSTKFNKIDKKVERIKKEKKHSKTPLVQSVQKVTQDAGIQTENNYDHLVNIGVMAHTKDLLITNDAQTMSTLDVGVLTPKVKPICSKKVQVCSTESSSNQPCFIVKNKRSRHPLRRKSQSESNITLKEEFIKTHDYGTCTEAVVRTSSPRRRLVNVKVGQSETRLNIDPSTSNQDLSLETPRVKPKVQKSAISIRPRKYSHSCSPISRQNIMNNCTTVMSTGSIKKLKPTRKCRSKSLQLNRDSLAEKINFNKETIMHHHLEIAALEKCLNEILNRLVREESPEIIPNGTSNNVSNESSQMKLPATKQKFEKNRIPANKLQKGKNCIEKLKQRSKFSRELATRANDNSNHSIKLAKLNNHGRIKSKTKLKNYQECNLSLSPVRVRSVYKNNRGFISSATSLSSKISDLMEYSSSNYPQSIPSLNIANNLWNKHHDFLRQTSSTEYRRNKNIVKKKHKISRKPTFSKKKSQSIYDMLMQYINLANTSSSKICTPESKALQESVSKIVVLSVSSVKFKHQKYHSLIPPSTITENVTDSLSSDQKAVATKDPMAISKKPFYISNNTAPTQNTQDVTSADSLEYDTHQTLNTTHNTPDLCPLTAIFNLEPPQYAYLVYNTEVISPNKPKIEPQPGPSGVTQHTASSPVNNPPKLVPILEEKPAETCRTPSAPDLTSNSSSVLDLDTLQKEKRTCELSPVLNRTVAYPSYKDCLQKLDEITSEIPEVKAIKTSRLTSFNCNDRECSQLIFNYTSKKDNKSPFLCENRRDMTGGYKTLTTILDNSESAFSDSETTLKNQNESGYESSKKMSTFKNFFKKRTLLDVFKSKNVSKKKSLEDTSAAESLKTLPRMISRTSLMDNNEVPRYKLRDEDMNTYEQNKTVLWFNFRKKKRDQAFPCDPWCSNRTAQMDETKTPDVCKDVCHKGTKCATTTTWKGILRKECPCNLDFEKQQAQCQKYASKVILEAAKRNEGYTQQYDEFKEMSLKDIIANRNCKCKDMRTSCLRSFANKVAAIQVKQESQSRPVQAKEGPSTPLRTSVRYSDEDEEVPSLIFGNDEDGSTRDDQSEIEVSTNDEDVSRRAVKPIDRLTDKEIFDKLLSNYERKDVIASRLSRDDTFFNEQIESVHAGIVVPDLKTQEHSPRQEEEKLRGPRFTDRPRPLVQVTNADTIVKPDDIGTCFARGFRPDNLMLSGDACFHINKQDKVKMSPYMLKNTESIIDFSERETPLDFLLALGFMVDEASNALKDDDIRSRLLAAITEARVWINKITTTQGTLLYLVAYKARPETMRYFLQLVEAIINKRINNAIRLDGFLRVLEDVEAGRLQMINILGEDKFEDEENEEKIVKKQLKNLFINVYTVAEKEASASGRTLTPMQISLLRILVAKYRAGLHPHLELIARYIGQGLLENEVQLEAAMIFLSRLDTAEVKLKEFENYCGIACQLQDT